MEPHLTLVDFLIGGLIAGYLVRPFMTLSHELGHAFVALRVTTDEVVVQVGRPPAMIEVNGERLKIRWSPLPSRGVGRTGFCGFTSGESTYLELCALYLAGPVMTALFGIACAIAIAWSWGGPPWITATFLMSTAWAVVSILASLDPRHENDDPALRPDGSRALSALRAWQAGHGAPTRATEDERPQ